MSMYDHPIATAKQVYAGFPPQTRDYLLRYIDHLVHRQLSPGSILTVISALQNFFSFLSREKQNELHSLNKEDVFKYIQHLTSKGLAPCTMNGYLSHLKMLFFYMMDDEILSSNPVLKRYYLKTPQRLPRPMEEEDIATFIKHIKGKPDEVIFLLMLHSGLRISEACHLEWKDIHWKNQQIIIHNGKGAVDRVVYFDNQVKKHLLDKKNTRSPWCPYCFPSPVKTHCPLKKGGIAKRMRFYLKECALDGKGYSPHSLRHSFATNMLNAGVSLWVLRDLMGHKKVDQTLEYAKLSNETIRARFLEAMEKIEHRESKTGRLNYERS